MTVTYWNPGRLTAAIDRAFRASLPVAVADAKATAPTRKAGARISSVSGRTATLMPTGLGWVFEKGRTPGYQIDPKRGRKALRLADGSFRSEVRGGAMAAKPYIRPAGIRWANGGFQAVAGRTLAASGFGSVLGALGSRR